MQQLQKNVQQIGTSSLCYGDLEGQIKEEFNIYFHLYTSLLFENFVYKNKKLEKTFFLTASPKCFKTTDLA